MSGILDFLNPIKAISDVAGGIISKFVADPTEKLKAQEALNEQTQALSLKAMDLQAQLTDAQSKIIVAEATSQSWLARNWRPLLMLTFTFAFAWNYIVVPIFGMAATTFPADAWTLMKIGVGGYIVGRSGEKIMDSYSNGGNGK